MRVLVVNDLVDAAQSLASLLRNCGYETHVCYSGEDALAVAKLKRPDTVLLDVSTSHAKGYEVARRLRSQSESPLKIVAVSGHEQPEPNAVFDHYVAKPARLNQLCSIIDCT